MYYGTQEANVSLPNPKLRQHRRIAASQVPLGQLPSDGLQEPETTGVA